METNARAHIWPRVVVVREQRRGWKGGTPGGKVPGLLRGHPSGPCLESVKMVSSLLPHYPALAPGGLTPISVTIQSDSGTCHLQTIEIRAEMTQATVTYY